MSCDMAALCWWWLLFIIVKYMIYIPKYNIQFKENTKESIKKTY